MYILDEESKNICSRVLLNKQIKTLKKMNKSLLIDRITEELFGRPLTLKSYQAMRNYLQQLDQDQLKEMLKEK